jgi:hypothetical protein
MQEQECRSSDREVEYAAMTKTPNLSQNLAAVREPRLSPPTTPICDVLEVCYWYCVLTLTVAMEVRECPDQGHSRYTVVEGTTDVHTAFRVGVSNLPSSQQLVYSCLDKVMQKTPRDLLAVDYRAMLGGIA